MKHYQNSKNKLTKTFLYLLLIAGLFFTNLMNAEGAGCKAGFTYIVNKYCIKFKNTSTSPNMDSTMTDIYLKDYGNSICYQLHMKGAWKFDSLVKVCNGKYKAEIYIKYKDGSNTCWDTFSQFVKVSYLDVDFSYNFINNDSNSGSLLFKAPPYFYCGIGGIFSSWDFGDGSKRSTDSPAIHHFNKAGTYKVCFYLTHDFGTYQVKDSLCKMIVIPNVTGIPNDNSQLSKTLIQIYPNPASDILNISLPPGSHCKCMVTITDLTGRAMLQTQFDGGNTNKQIDLKAFQSGIYIISVDAGDGNMFKSRLVIQP